MNQLIKAVTFDAGGTLIHLTEPVGDTYSKIAREFDIAANPGTLEASFREVWGKTPPPFHSNSTDPEENEKQWWREMVNRVFENALETADFTSPENFELFFDRLYDFFAEPGTWELDRDARKVLKYLEENGVRAGIISNFDGRLHRILDDLGILSCFEMVVISNEIRVSKPDRRIFDYAISKLNLPAFQIIHVGDDPVCDIGGAAAAGLNTFLVGRKHEPLIHLIGKLPLAKT